MARVRAPGPLARRPRDAALCASRRACAERAGIEPIAGRRGRISQMATMRARCLRSAILLAAGGTLALGLLACGADSERADVELPASLAVSPGEWTTDFSRHSVPLEDFRSGGPPKDGIAAIDDPKFVSTASARSFLEPDEPVAVLERNGETHLYPLQILVWHEIVNDELGGEPVAVTYCPLCNSTVAFSRAVDGRTLDFGTTGRLRNSDLVMYDRQTESWWQQLTAEAVVGELTGVSLEVLPSQILSYADAARSHADALVLSRETGFDRDYGANPYVGYDDPDSEPFLLDSAADPRLPAKERVASVRTGERSAVVYPFSRLTRSAPIDDEIDGRPVVVLYDPDAASALDAASVPGGRAVGSAGIFDRRIDGRRLSFGPGSGPGLFRDRQTGSTWDASGLALDGPLTGERLEQIPSDDGFWFAIAAFLRDVEIRGDG